LQTQETFHGEIMKWWKRLF